MLQILWLHRIALHVIQAIREYLSMSIFQKEVECDYKFNAVVITNLNFHLIRSNNKRDLRSLLHETKDANET